MLDALSSLQILPSQIIKSSFCLKKDLYAVAFVSGQVTCYRLNGSVVCTPLRPKSSATQGPIASLSWRPDGRYLAIGYESGAIRLYETETGQCVATLNERFTTSIRALLWTCDLTQRSSFSATPERLRGKSYVYESLPRLNSLKKTNISAIQGSGLNAEDALSVLFSASGDRFEICVNGVFSLGLFSDLERHIEDSSFSPNLERLYVLSSEGHSESRFYLDMWSAELLSHRKKDLSRISSLAMQINGLNSYIQEAVGSIQTECRLIAVSLKKHVDLLKGIIEEHGLERSLTNELVYFMAFGSSTSVIVEYLLHSVDDKSLEAWDKSVASACSNMKKVLINQLFPSAQQLLIAVKEIVGYMRSYETIYGLSADSTPSNGLDTIVQLFYCLADFDVVLKRQSEGFSTFIKWLGTERKKLLDPSGSPSEVAITEDLIEFSKIIFQVDPFIDFCQDLEDEPMDTVSDQVLPDDRVAMFPPPKQPMAGSFGQLVTRIANECQMLLNNFGHALGTSIRLSYSICLPEVNFVPEKMSYISDELLSCEHFLLRGATSSSIEYLMLLRRINGFWSVVQVNATNMLDFSGSIRSIDFKDSENLVLLVDDHDNDSSCLLTLNFSTWDFVPLDNPSSEHLEAGIASIIHTFEAGWRPLEMMSNQGSIAFQTQQSLAVFCFAEDE